MRSQTEGFFQQNASPRYLLDSYFISSISWYITSLVGRVSKPKKLIVFIKWPSLMRMSKIEILVLEKISIFQHPSEMCAVCPCAKTRKKTILTYSQILKMIWQSVKGVLDHGCTFLIKNVDLFLTLVVRLGCFTMITIILIHTPSKQENMFLKD